MNETAIMEMPLRAEDRIKIPHDLSAWASVEQLRDWIMADVATLDWTSAGVLELLRKHPDFEPKALLNTMVFAYTTGVFGAEEIERRCSEDLTYRGVRPKLPPRASELTKFRKQNLGLFKWCLVNVLSRALKTQFVEGPTITNLPAGLQRFVVENASERLELARHMDRTAEML